ncbi:MAG TPA: HAD-IIB family hydrolase [Pirellulaceae bacterium]|nr:HAD-IIB family hydrolase [Pirellulaceae bacterium]
MSQQTREPGPHKVLALDLDGTLIPLDDNARHRHDLRVIAGRVQADGVILVFVTGRHLASVEQAIHEHDLPHPEWIICDVGASMVQKSATGPFQEVERYHRHLDAIIQALPLADVRENLRDVGGLRLQEEAKQGRFKLSYYAEAAALDEIVRAMQRLLAERDAPYSIISSIDPFLGVGLIDVLPRQVSKAYALEWWLGHVRFARESVVFAGDSGNDLAALTAGFRTIVVGNADRRLAQQVSDAHRDRNWDGRLHLAESTATSGVLEGCWHFELFSADATAEQPPVRREFGATYLGNETTYFRVWAPRRQTIEVEIRRSKQVTRQPLARTDNGFFVGEVTGTRPGDRYQFVLDHTLRRPDPASRFQPAGVHRDSQIVDSSSYRWQTADWPGIAKQDLIIYELHIGTFTTAGTFTAAIERLDELVDLGITAVELMPLAECPGRWNWGYDGVGLFAVRHTYGTPDDLKRLVDACHARGLAILLDVVYNHLGPEGNYLADFGPYNSNKHRTPWGDAINFDGRHSDVPRSFVIENALYWLDEYQFDGLRLDAAYFMRDNSDTHILEELARHVQCFRERVNRSIYLIAETNVYDQDLLAGEHADSIPYNAIWSDDIMHSIYSVVTPETKVTHRQFHGARDLHEALQQGYIYAGREYRRAAPHPGVENSLEAAGPLGSTAAPPPSSLTRWSHSQIIALQNHDCVGNHPCGNRIHHLTSMDHQKAAAALVLLYPSIPLIFMGEEVASPVRFHFFVDFEDPHLRTAVALGREREYPQDLWPEAFSALDEQAFRTSKCVVPGDATMRQWYQTLLRLRKQWQQQGWLEPAHFHSRWVPEFAIFSLHYRVMNGPELFVLARLHPPNQPHPACQIETDGELLLDSISGTAASGLQRVVFNSVRAVVGTGRARVSNRATE